MQQQISHTGIADNMILGLIIAIGFGTIEDALIRVFIICATAFIAGIVSKTGQEIQPILKNSIKKLINKIRCKS